jgi:hypothetical protein
MNNQLKIVPILTNQRISPYKKFSTDQIQLKAQVFIGERLSPSYLEGLPINLYLNFGGSWVFSGSSITNRVGFANILYSCEDIVGYEYCLAKFNTIVNDVNYESNVTRINFFGRDPSSTTEHFIMSDQEIVMESGYFVL